MSPMLPLPSWKSWMCSILPAPSCPVHTSSPSLRTQRGHRQATRSERDRVQALRSEEVVFHTAVSSLECCYPPKHSSSNPSTHHASCSSYCSPFPPAQHLGTQASLCPHKRTHLSGSHQVSPCTWPCSPSRRQPGPSAPSTSPQAPSKSKGPPGT